MRIIKDICKGKWHDILEGIGIDGKFLKNEHGACPLCGGKDRYRWNDNNGTGSYFCNQCGSGSGIELVSKFLKVDYPAAWREVEKHLSVAKIRFTRKNTSFTKQIGDRVWRESESISRNDPVWIYLKKRGILTDKIPAVLRYNPHTLYYDKETKSKSYHPAMIARLLSPCGKETSTHITYLTEHGEKSEVERVRIVKGKMPKGGAVRLAYSSETMGIAEGIETALSASKLYDLPVWSAINAGELLKWQPPKNVKHVIIFGDNDASFTGQAMSYGLARRLKLVNNIEAEVRLPDFQGDDWNDVLESGVI